METTRYKNPRMRGSHRIIAYISCMLALTSTSIHTANIERETIAGSEVVRVRIPDPRHYWDAAGFREMTPPMRLCKNPEAILFEVASFSFVIR